MRKVNYVEPPDLFVEDFHVGMEFPTISKGPMMVGHQVRWAGATDNYDSEFHHDEYVAKAQGLPGIVLSGPLIAAYLRVAVEGWTGRNAHLRRFSNRNSSWTLPRDMVYMKGSVSGISADANGTHLVEIECWVENQDGVVTTPAKATAVVPSRNA